MTEHLPIGTELEAVDAFFAHCVRQALAKESWPDWPADWSGRESERAIIARSQFHGVAVLLAQAQDAFADWPVVVADALREETRLASLWEETHRQTLSALLGKLAYAGIAATVMKGTALAYRYYDVPAIRRRGDTDLLVSPEQAHETRRVLEDAGFIRRSDPHGLYYQETWIFSLGAALEHAIDLHWEPTDRPLLQRILPFDEFVRNAISLPRLGEHVNAPRPMLMLVHGAINQAWHEARGFFVDNAKIVGGRRLIWSVDYAHLTTGFSDADWQELVRYCETRDARSIVHSALKGAQEDLHLKVPETVLSELDQDPEASPTHTYIASPDTISDAQTDLIAADSAATRLWILRKAVISPREHLLMKYPHLAHWPTVALQLRRYAGLIGRLLRRAEKP